MAKPKKPTEKDLSKLSDADFTKWTRNFVEKLPAIARKIGLSQKEVDKVKASHSKWEASYQNWKDTQYEYARTTEIVAKLAFKLGKFDMGKREICKRKCTEILMIDGDERIEAFHRRAHEMLKKLEE